MYVKFLYIIRGLKRYPEGGSLLFIGNEKKTKDQQDKAMKVIKEKYATLGHITLHELQVKTIFLCI